MNAMIAFVDPAAVPEGAVARKGVGADRQARLHFMVVAQTIAASDPADASTQALQAQLDLYGPTETRTLLVELPD
jgi:hypothetical protein